MHAEHPLWVVRSWSPNSTAEPERMSHSLRRDVRSSMKKAPVTKPPRERGSWGSMSTCQRLPTGKVASRARDPRVRAPGAARRRSGDWVRAEKRPVRRAEGRSSRPGTGSSERWRRDSSALPGTTTPGGASAAPVPTAAGAAPSAVGPSGGSARTSRAPRRSSGARGAARWPPGWRILSPHFLPVRRQRPCAESQRRWAPSGKRSETWPRAT